MSDSQTHDPDHAIGTHDHDVLALVARLPAPEFESAAAERIRRRARAAFLRQAGRARHPWLERLARWYGRVEPIMAAAVATSYLVWGFTSAMALYQ